MKETSQMLGDASIRKTAYDKEEADARTFIKMLAAGLRYPDGKPPRMGATVCRDWLYTLHDEDSFEARLLNLVEIHDDDIGWSIDGAAQGDPGILIDWILGDPWPEESDWLEDNLKNYYSELGGLVIEAYERRNGKSPQQAK